MNEKKFWEWFIDPAGNLITEAGRFKLVQVDANGLPIAPLQQMKPKKDLKELSESLRAGAVTEINKQEPNTKLSFFEKLQQKFPAIKILVLLIVDLFTGGAASKIEKSISDVFTNDDDKPVQNYNLGDQKMVDAIKTFIAPKLVQWVLKAAGGVLAGLGISSGAVEEIIVGALVFILSAIWSLIKTGKIALTDPKDFLEIK